jgi:hypothetical protein
MTNNAAEWKISLDRRYTEDEVVHEHFELLGQKVPWLRKEI